MDRLSALPLTLLLVCGISYTAVAKSTDANLQPLLPSGFHWHSDYGDAWQQAEQTGKMLLIWFQGETPSSEREDVQHAFASDALVREKLPEYVLLKLPADAHVVSGGETIRLLDHAAFTEMHNHEGLAIVDLSDPTADTFEHVVSAFPFMRGKYYRFQSRDLPVILDLPHGFITERTMIWAVRVHPENPASTRGQRNSVLAAQAKSHSRYQASILLQGHHRWENRFHHIRQLLGDQYTPIEVVAESWPEQNMIDSCIDCVASWRQSSGHWSAVKAQHALYGYDIRRGENGIWYGTGIFASYE